MTLHKNIGHWVIFFSALFLLTGCAQAKQNKEDEELLLQIKEDMATIYNEDFSDLHVSIEEKILDKVGVQLKQLNKQENVSDDNQIMLDELTMQHDTANQMYDLEQEINNLLKLDGQLKRDLLEEKKELIEQFKSYTTYYDRQTENLQEIHDAIEKRIAQEKQIEKTETFIASLYKDDQLKDSLKKKDYKKLEKLIKTIEDEKLVQSFKAELNKVDKKLVAIAKEKAEEEKRIAEDKRKEEERIAAEDKRKEEERIAAEEKRKEEERMAAEEKRKTEEQIAANEKKKADKKQNQSSNQSNKGKEQAPAKDKDQSSAGNGLPSEPTYVSGVIIASKKYPLPKNYAPGESGEARSAFNEMAKAAKADGIQLTAFSTYRSFDYQRNLYNNYVSRDGQEAADRYSAKPGYSEHQTGLAFDIGDSNNQGAFFQENKATNWLAKEAYKYGFIMRYPKGKEGITGYMYEPWHYRYVGKSLAGKIYNQQTTLEEYFGL